jgi:CRP-like cAMP-binding protein
VKLKRTSAIASFSTPDFPAFAPIVSDAFEHLKCLPQGTSVAKGVFVVEQGVSPSAVYLLREGLVKLVYIAPDGRETILGLRAAGWYAGAVASLMHAPSHYSIKTVTPCVFSIIAADEFSPKLMQSARLMRHFMDTLCNELISQSAEAQLRLISAEKRLAHFMAERYIQNPQWHTLDPLPLLKQMELAQLLAITPEHLSRLLHKTPHIEAEPPSQMAFSSFIAAPSMDKPA